MSGISTHVLDTSTGRPAANVRVRLLRGDKQIGSASTNADGRCPALLPPTIPLEPAIYRIVFETAGLFPNGFFPEVSISFAVRDSRGNYHVPLLLSAFGYTTYRGS